MCTIPQFALKGWGVSISDSPGASQEATYDQELLRIADELTPELYTADVYPREIIEVDADATAFQGWKTRSADRITILKAKALGKNDTVVLDFGDHLVGHLSFSVEPTGSPPDAPLKLKLTFGEMPCEIAERFETYAGWLSSSWLQEETIFVDFLPAKIQLPRRYSFRYLKLTVVDTSIKYRVLFTDVYCTAVTAGDNSRIRPLPAHLPEDLKTMDRIAIKTLQDCTQTVFEDGPKRDRRLWLGDLRLQALANYCTFDNHNLVKRCLYLFAGIRLKGGVVGACLFEKPYPHIDDTILYDYSLLFIATLYDYYVASQDREALTALWPTAAAQIEFGIQRLDERGIVRDDSSWWCFIDWHPELNKQAPAQAVLIYSLKKGLELATLLNLDTEQASLVRRLERVSQAALEHLWDPASGFFNSGADRQISWASQVWMALAGVLSLEETSALLERLFTQPPNVGITTPYMYHHLIEALFLVGNKHKAIEQMRAYWGGMIEDGADCFWELYNPRDKRLSPYGSNLINSYCHAWSCTPTYFIRKYLI